MQVKPQIEESWGRVLAEEFQKPYFLELKQFLLDEFAQGKTVFPPGKQIFNAFAHTPFDEVKVVILGQDPYHGTGQAHGLCFSVADGVKPPPSLVNIFKEIHEDLGLEMAQTGNLEKWSSQGVLLLNAILTVRAHQAASHQKKGWEQFTDAVIARLSQEREGIVFLLWGKYAQEKGKMIDTSKHFVLQAPHPSPFSANSGFFGCRHFSMTNEILTAQGKDPIDWSV